MVVSIVQKSDLGLVDNWHPKFWTLEDVLSKIDLELSDREYSLLSVFFKKIKKDFGITESLRLKILQYLHIKFFLKEEVRISFSVEERRQMNVVLASSLEIAEELRRDELKKLEEKFEFLRALWIPFRDLQLETP